MTSQAEKLVWIPEELWSVCVTFNVLVVEDDTQQWKWNTVGCHGNNISTYVQRMVQKPADTSACQVPKYNISNLTWTTQQPVILIFKKSPVCLFIYCVVSFITICVHMVP